MAVVAAAAEKHACEWWPAGELTEFLSTARTRLACALAVCLAGSWLEKGAPATLRAYEEQNSLNYWPRPALVPEACFIAHVQPALTEPNWVGEYAGVWMWASVCCMHCYISAPWVLLLLSSGSSSLFLAAFRSRSACRSGTTGTSRGTGSE